MRYGHIGLVFFVMAVTSAFCLSYSAESVAEEAFVNESARDIPIAHEVDVAIVGGSTGAVAAAIEAAEAGASVFLVAPYPYLGEDMTATLRLWLDKDETPSHPLAERIFADNTAAPGRPGLAFAYEADPPSVSPHNDTDPPSRLTDGQWGSASDESVQYEDDVTILADLGSTQYLEEVRIVVYRRDHASPQGSGFNVREVEVSIRDDRASWETIAEVEGEPGAGLDFYVLQAPVGAETRHVRLKIAKPTEYERILLGEIEMIGGEEPPQPSRQLPRRLHVKQTLDQALLDAGVEYLYGGMAAGVLRDAEGDPAGIVIANRAGRQAVVARTIIDATSQGLVARLAGARFREYPAGTHTFQRTVIGGGVREGENVSARTIVPVARINGEELAVIEYTLELPMADGGHAAWMEADQRARTMTYDPDQQWTSDMLFQIPPDSIDSRGPAAGSWEGVQAFPLSALQPEGVRGIHVLGGHADAPRDQAEQLMRPPALIALGARVGAAAAEEALSAGRPEDIRLPGEETEAPAAAGDVRERLEGLRPTAAPLPVVAQAPRALPVLAEYDIVVIGGGTSGAPAAIAAAREGARVLVIEYQAGLGGTGTLGMIGSAWYGRDDGFSAEVPFPREDNITIENKMEWYRREIRDAGGDIWFGVLGCGAFVEGERVRGAVAATPWGRGVVLADVVIDATGNADIAGAAGAETLYGATEDGEIAMQGAGLPERPPYAQYVNTDYLLVDELDMVDVWSTLTGARLAMRSQAFDSGTLVQVRERHRIRGEHVMTYLDQIAGRTYPDSIVLSRSSYDSHGYPNHPFFALMPHTEQSLVANQPAPGGEAYTPYRCLLPTELEGILVIGLGISMERDASALMRMQHDIANQGYAAGIAAVMAVEDGLVPRDVDVRALQRHLVDIGNIPEDVLDHEDSFPLPPVEVALAVGEMVSEDRDRACRALARVMAHRAAALPFLQLAYEAAIGEARLRYAKLLGFWGEESVADDLLQALEGREWDDKISQGWMAEYAHNFTPVDTLLLALAYSGDDRALPVVLDWMESLDASVTLSHHRAVALALEHIGSPEAAEPLARLLEKPGMSGHVMTGVEKLHNENREKRRRKGPLREIVLARALYRCGDHEGVGERILKEFTGDVRGLFIRHAEAVLGDG